jgi:hypothetical protein
MKTYQQTVRVGEKTGEIDWSYNFLQHFSSYCCTGAVKQEMCDRAVQMLREIEQLHKEGKKLTVAHRGYDRKLLDIGMYDGWPFWKPTPALMVVDPVFGNGVWEFYYDLQGYNVVE